MRRQNTDIGWNMLMVWCYAYMLSRAFTYNKTLQTNQTEYLWKCLVVSTVKHTLQNACKHSECFLFGVGTLEMCKRKCTFCFGQESSFDWFNALKVFGVCGNLPWIDWNVCFYIVIMSFSPEKCLKFQPLHLHSQIIFLETVWSFWSGSFLFCLRFWPMRNQ